MYNVAAVMCENTVEIKKFQAAMEADPVVGKLMDAAETVEDMYEVAKRYIQIKFEDFSQVFNEAMDYFKGSKVELEDDMMECVVGGSWSSFWNGFKKVAIAAAVCVAVVGAAVVTGGIAGAVGGAVVAACTGGVVGDAVVAGVGGGMLAGFALSTRKMYEGYKSA